jgi:chromosome segregation ATPase
MSKVESDLFHDWPEEESQKIIKHLQLVIALKKENEERMQEAAKIREDELQAEISKYMTALQHSENELAMTREMARMRDERITKLLESLNKSVEIVGHLQKEHEEELKKQIDSKMQEINQHMQINKHLADAYQNLQRDYNQLLQTNENLVTQVQSYPIALKRQYEAGHANGYAKGVREGQPNRPIVE